MVSVDSFSIGKHRGRSFEDVVSEDPDYCRWAFRLEDPKGDVAEFTTYLRQHYGGILTFGKHSGKLFSEIVTEDPDYCGWALTIPDPSPSMAEFVEFLSQNMDTRARGRQSKKQINQSHRGNRAFEHMYEAANQTPKMQQHQQQQHKQHKQQQQPHPAASSWQSLKPTKAEATTKKQSMSEAPVTATPVKKKILKKGASSKAPQENGCKICMDGAVETVFVPCGHMVACSACGEQFKKQTCPMCREKVKMVVRTFTA